ncbi:MAG TPA: hypothetical protein VFA20_09565 [Myxococcaceae bacterium]|nr:hypothetical protein [Myxococcaceae bacterium]
MRLSAGRGGIEVEDAVAALAAYRCPELEAFREPGETPALHLRRSPPLAEGEPLGTAGGYTVDGDGVRVWMPEEPLAAEAALRLAFAVAFQRQGGLLLHAVGICFPGGAWLGVGPSGCGKSTLAQRCADAGAEVLSDETVGWLPDGTLWPTPFRSSARFTWRARPEPRPLSMLAFLEHGRLERVDPLSPAEVVKRLLAQVYRIPGAGGLDAVATLIALAEPVRFMFRDDPAAAAFVRRALGRE